MESKYTIRTRLLQERSALHLDLCEEKSKRIQTSVLQLDEWKRAACVLCYESFYNEVKTTLLLDDAFNNKILFIPSPIEKNDPLIMKVVSYSNKGTFELVPTDDFLLVDLVVVPGIAFDERGYRVGFGGGYYDKLLKNGDATTIGLAYEFQMIDRVPDEPYDVAVDTIVTEDRVITTH